MMSTLFLFFLLIISFLRMPLALLPVVFRGIHPFLRNRLDFERKNLLDHSAQSFGTSGIKASLCFEVSSEGELEQVRPLMEEELLQGRPIEILYSSPSVEKKIQQLMDFYPQLVRGLRLPLLSFWPFSFLYFQNFWFWVTAPVVVFCRYDFFPEILLLKLFRKKFVLISGATKNLGLYKKLAFKLFDLIVAATPNEEKKFQALLPIEVLYCDLRIPRIAQRKMRYLEVLFQQGDANVGGYCQMLQQLGGNEKIVFGSFWPSDLGILKSDELIKKVLGHQLHLCIVPHKLDALHLGELRRALQDLFGLEAVGLLSATSAGASWRAVTIVDQSGILCELYSLFTLAYVGGGYERSIHSVLEPFVSGAKVICGPKTKRSTEYDLVREAAFSEIHVLKNPLSFYTIVKEFQQTNADLAIRERMLEFSLINKKAISEKIQKLRE